MESVVPAESLAEDDLPTLEAHGPVPTPRFVLAVEGQADILVCGRRAREAALGARALLIGRRDPLSGVYPEIDLSGHPGAEYVSRQHARIELCDGRVYVTDLRGRGMTAVDGAGGALAAERPTELADGGRLIIGEDVVFTLRQAEE